MFKQIAKMVLGSATGMSGPEGFVVDTIANLAFSGKTPKSSKQLPAYEAAYDEMVSLGIHAVYCMSVNDSFVMNAWAKDLGISKVEMIPDGDGMFTRGMNMLVDKPFQGFGMRSWRYAMVVNNKKVEKMFVEEGLNNLGLDDDPYVESTPDKVLEYLNSI